MTSLGIVMFANESWAAIGVRQRELATWLSERWDVLFVDRFNYRRFPLRHRQCYRQLIVSFRSPVRSSPDCGIGCPHLFLALGGASVGCRC